MLRLTIILFVLDSWLAIEFFFDENLELCIEDTIGY